MSGTPNQTAGFDFQAWNTAAEAQLLAEFQAMAINAARDAETPSWRRGLHDTFHYVAGIPVSAVDTTRPTPATPTPTPSVLGAGSCPGPASFINHQQLKTVLFVMASTAVYALPSVIDASPGDRLSKIVDMLKEVAASGVVAGLSVKAVAAIEQALISRCEDIAASCAAPILAKTVAQFVAVRSTCCLPLLILFLNMTTGEYKCRSCSSHYPCI
jgi:hypothetical protein